MRRLNCGACGVAILLVAWLGASCDSEVGIPIPNAAPDTRISAGPPEASDTGFNVNLFWFGWDDDGYVDHYEIAWEDTSNWYGPIFGNDSLFVVQAAANIDRDSDAALPDWALPLPDSVYEQWHTFFVRAVDEDDTPDRTPALRSFNAKTIAPYTVISFGPRGGQWWSPDVEFEWQGLDDDGVVVSYLYMLTTRDEYFWDTGDDPTTLTLQELIPWLDTLTFRPLQTGGYSSERVWKPTEEDSVVFLALPPTDTQLGTNYIFTVRAIDNAGAMERRLQAVMNAREFNVSNALSGPRIRLSSNIAGTWLTGDPEQERGLFAGQGLRFQWYATPGPAGYPIAGYRYAVEDTAQWSQYSLNATEWPPPTEDDPEPPWNPGAGSHTFFVQAVDIGGFSTVLAARLEVFPGPRDSDPEDRYVLVVLDADPSTLVEDGIFPGDSQRIERATWDFFLGPRPGEPGFSYRVFETGGARAPGVALMNDASTTILVHSSDVSTGADNTILRAYHLDPAVANVLPSYVDAGGNLLICGINPCEAMRFYEDAQTGQPLQEPYPVEYYRTVTDTTVRPHWAFTGMGIRRIEGRVLNTSIQNIDRRMSVVTSENAAGTNPYPDLHFDPMSWPNGPRQRGFGFYDYNVEPQSGVSTVIYSVNDTGIPVGIRKYVGPGVNGNVIYLAFHPYFVAKLEFRRFVRAALEDFGEVPIG